MRLIKKGAVDQAVDLYVFDNTTGLPVTGLVFNSSGIDLWYRRELEAKTSITEATLAALTTAHADGGFKEIGNGWYRLDLPDAAVATGADYVLVSGTFTGYTVVGEQIQLVAVDLQNAVRMGLTALPNAAADAAGGLPISDAGGLDLDAQLVTKINDILVDTGTTLDDLIDTEVATIITNLATVAGYLDTEIAAIIALLGTPAGASLAADLAAIEAQTDDIGAAGAGLTAVPWNASWDAEVQSEATDALNAYDPPTKAELDSAVSPLATAANLATVDGIVDDILLDTAEIGAAGAGLTNINLPNQTMDIVGNITGNLSGSVGSVTGAVGSVTAGVNATSINGSAAAAEKLAEAVKTQTLGTVDTAGITPTTTTFDADDITEATADHFKGKIISWRSGALAGQSTDITAYSLASGRGRFVVTAMTEAPANNDTFIIT